MPILSTPAQIRSFRQPGGSAGAVASSRIQAEETQQEIYIIKQTGVIEEAFAHQRIVAGVIYVIGGVVSGQLAQTAGAATYLGRTQQFLPEVRLLGDENYPVLIPETSLSEGQVARMYVKGTAGDQLLLIYR